MAKLELLNTLVQFKKRKQKATMLVLSYKNRSARTMELIMEKYILQLNQIMESSSNPLLWHWWMELLLFRQQQQNLKELISCRNNYRKHSNPKMNKLHKLFLWRQKNHKRHKRHKRQRKFKRCKKCKKCKR